MLGIGPAATFRHKVALFCNDISETCLRSAGDGRADHQWINIGRIHNAGDSTRRRYRERAVSTAELDDVAGHADTSERLQNTAWLKESLPTARRKAFRCLDP